MTLQETWRRLRIDLARNIYPKSYVVITLYRLAHYFSVGGKMRLLVGSPVIGVYLFLTKWMVGIEIPPKTDIGEGFVIYHGFGLVINGESRLGRYVTVRQGCCIGNTVDQHGNNTAPPVIGNHVELGVNALVLGDIRVEDGARIGAGAVVIKDCLANSTYVGVPAVRKTSSRSG